MSLSLGDAGSLAVTVVFPGHTKMLFVTHVNIFHRTEGVLLRNKFLEILVC